MCVALVNDLKMDMLEAMKLVYFSDIFMKLSDSNTEFYKKSWQEIYEMLKIEISQKP